MDRLLYLYLATGIFGAGVIIVLFLSNAFASFGDGDEGPADSEFGDDSSDDGFSDDASDTDGNDGFDDSDDISSDDGDSENSTNYVVDYNRYRSRGILQFMSTLRTMVFFCVGFGTVGSFALLTGESRISSLIWSIPVGIVTVLIFHFFKNMQQKKLDSSIQDKELIQQRGTALLPFSGSSIGKVKITFGSLQIERYAKCSSPDDSIAKGDPVIVQSTDDEYVYVKKG